MGGTERVDRQHASARLTVRERLVATLDDGACTEIGALAGQATYDGDESLTGFRASNVPIGTATITARPVADPADTRAILTDRLRGDYRVLGHDLGPTARGLRP